MTTPFVFYSHFDSFSVSGSLEVYNADGQPTSIITTKEDWFVRISLQTKGSDCLKVKGIWKLESFLGSITAVKEDKPIKNTLNIPLTPGSGPISYGPLDINFVGPTDVDSTLFRLFTTVTCFDEVGKHYPIGGFAEGPYLLFVRDNDALASPPLPSVVKPSLISKPSSIPMSLDTNTYPNTDLSSEQQWIPLSSFTVEFQSLAVEKGEPQAHRYRTTVYHLEMDTTVSWPGIESTQLCQWMREQLDIVDNPAMPS